LQKVLIQKGKKNGEIKAGGKFAKPGGGKMGGQRFKKNSLKRG